MKALFFRGVALLLILPAALRAAEPQEETIVFGAVGADGKAKAATIDDTMKRAVLDYAERLRVASEQLGRARERIAQAKAPLLKALRAAEDRMVSAQSEISRLEIAQEQSADTHHKLALEADALRKNESYVATLAHDSLTAFTEGMLPAEKTFLAEETREMETQFNDPARAAAQKTATTLAGFLLEQIQHDLGGYTIPGNSLIDGDNRMVPGTFAVTGPEAFFRGDGDGVAGTVRVREGSGHAVTFPLADWKTASARDFFQGRLASIPADASGGKALRLREAKGTIWQHINKGGVVSYAILCVGLVALLMIVQKSRDLARMRLDEPGRVQQFIEVVATGTPEDAERALRSLRATTRELFAVGVRHLGKPKDILEEHLYAVLLRQRLHFERWLPLLAVIATAAPLMGLLGTVTGMVRTFALITVFGTGNAGKLASGISEVLVATELGLIVAIPTLIAHGFLAHRIQKNLALLERYALEFVTAAQPENSREESTETIPA